MQSSQGSPRFGRDTGIELKYLVRSGEPAIVFSSLAHLCVPTFCDGCSVDIAEDDDVGYRICYPWSKPAISAGSAEKLTGRRRFGTDRGYAVRTRFVAIGYTGMITHLWHTRVPTPADVSRALLLASHGVRTVQEERYDVARQHADDIAGSAPAVVTVSRTLDPTVAALLEARAQRLRQWARCEREHIARP